MKRLEYTAGNSARDMFLFDSMTEITNFIDPTLFVNKDSSFTGRDGLNTWDNTSNATRDEWVSGLQTLGKFVEDLKKADLPPIKSKKRRMEFSDEGDEVDYDKMMSGNPEFFKTCVREESDGPTTVTIVIDTTTPANRQSEDILWRGAAAIALTILLEDRGYTVELWCVNGSKLWGGKNTGVMTAFCLKKTSDPLDYSTLVNTVSGWFYRSVTFTLLETMAKHAGERTAYGYGTCHNPDQTDLDKFNDDELRIYSSGVFSYSGALRLMEDELKRIVKPQTDMAENN